MRVKVGTVTIFSRSSFSMCVFVSFSFLSFSFCFSSPPLIFGGPCDHFRVTFLDSSILSQVKLTLEERQQVMQQLIDFKGNRSSSPFVCTFVFVVFSWWQAGFSHTTPPVENQTKGKIDVYSGDVLSSSSTFSLFLFVFFPGLFQSHFVWFLRVQQ